MNTAQYKYVNVVDSVKRDATQAPTINSRLSKFQVPLCNVNLMKFEHLYPTTESNLGSMIS